MAATDPADQQRPSPFSYTSYRELLRDWLSWRQRVEPSYTYAQFLSEAGRAPTAKGAVSNLLSGRDNLSADRAEDIIRALMAGPSPLESEEAAQLRMLIPYTQAVERRHRYESEGRADEQLELVQAEIDELEARIHRGRALWSSVHLGREKLAYVFRWYCPVIREMALHPDFRPDPDWIVARLRGAVSQREVQDALTTLERLDLLIPDAHGVLRAQPGVVMTPDTRLGEEGLAYHIAMHRHAGRWLDPAMEPLREGSEFRTHSLFLGVTLGLRQGELKELKTVLFRMQEELAARFDTTEPERIFQVNLNLFPLTGELGSSEEDQASRRGAPRGSQCST